MTKRRALRGYRGRTETPPAKLSACATCHYPRALCTATGRCGYRHYAPHYARMGRTAIFARHYAPQNARKIRTRIARDGSPPRIARGGSPPRIARDGSPSRCAALHPAPSPCAPPVPCHLAGFGVQSRSMSASRLHRPRPWGLPTPPGLPAPWRLAYRLWGLPTARAASSAGTFSRRKETSNRKNDTPP